jgi:putative FmdB family regulatory protein
MPTYEYECRNCSLRFEVKRRFGDDGASFCPSCGSAAHRIFSPVPIIFKGPGFYVTDNRKNHNRPLDRKNTDKAEPDKKEE